ncbi:hypothetical protein SAMN05216603_12258 [Pseudomonas benzenivorans]|nr:hypothetical protein SAMN05216603_12258 [Pseudomonas benzenivorans]
MITALALLVLETPRGHMLDKRLSLRQEQQA